MSAAPVLPPWLALTGRAAVVTGAGSPTGIGFACARALGEQPVGPEHGGEAREAGLGAAGLRQKHAAGQLVGLRAAFSSGGLVCHRPSGQRSCPLLALSRRPQLPAANAVVLAESVTAVRAHLADLSPRCSVVGAQLTVDGRAVNEVWSEQPERGRRFDDAAVLRCDAGRALLVSDPPTMGAAAVVVTFPVGRDPAVETVPPLPYDRGGARLREVLLVDDAEQLDLPGRGAGGGGLSLIHI